MSVNTAERDVEDGIGAEIAAATSADNALDSNSRVVELVDDGEEPPPPMAVAASLFTDGKAGAGPEIMHDDGPFNPSYASDLDTKVAAKKRAVPILDDGGIEGPVHPTTFERGTVDSKTMRPAKLSQPGIRPNRSTFEERFASLARQKIANPPATSSDGLQHDNNLATRTDPIEDNATQIVHTGNVAEPPRSNERPSSSRIATIGRQSSVPGITEAYLVDDDIILATPAEPQLPWYKQKRTKLLIAFVVVLVIVLAISLGVTLSADRTVTQFVTTTSSPTTSAMPSFHPTDAPSASGMPSSAPSLCSDKVATNTRRVELLRSDPTSPIVAVDGTNLVVAWKQFTGAFQLQGSFYTAFYSLADNNSWELSGYFIEANVRWTEFDNAIGYDVALSDQTAIIGLPALNQVYLYRQNNAGLWEKVASPEPKDQVSECGGFGTSVDICDDSIVVSDSSYCSGTKRSWAMPSENAAYIFKQIERQWKEVGRILLQEDWPGSGDVINNDEVVEAMYDVEVCGAKYLASTADDQEDEVHIYQWDGTTRNSVLFQTLSSESVGFGQTLAMDGDILVVGSANHTHIFSQENAGAVWGEALKLDQSYDSYEISGRVLIATNETGVYSISIEDCTPEMPAIAEPASADECHPVSIATRFWYIDPTEEEECFTQDWYPWEMSFVTDELLESDSTVVETISPRGDQECGYTSSTCLYPGRYKVKFNTDWTFHCYNVTVDFLDGDGKPIEPAIMFHDCTFCYVLDGNVAFFDMPYDPATLRMGPPTSPPQTAPPQTPLLVTPFPTEGPKSIDPTATQWPTPVTPYPTSQFPTWSPTDESTASLCGQYTAKKTCTKATVGCDWDELSDPPCLPG